MVDNDDSFTFMLVDGLRVAGAEVRVARASETRVGDALDRSIAGVVISPGPGHPAVYRVHYVCAVCGDEHPALLSEPELDCGPVAPTTDLAFVNVLTGRSEPVADEISGVAEHHLRRGNWPWTFYCACEHEVRPGPAVSCADP